MKDVGMMLLLLAAMTLTARVKRRQLKPANGTNPINWNKMKEIYRMLPKFFDFNDRLMKKISRISPSDLFLIGKKRQLRLVHMFTKTERELDIPCGLYWWTIYATKEVELLGTSHEKRSLRRLEKALGKILGADKTKKCTFWRGSGPEEE